MLITSRVSFLCLFVASFMGLWSQDEQASHETIMAEAQARDTSAIVKQEEERANLVTETEAAPPIQVSHKVAEPVATTTSDIEIPDYIAAGFYRAVSHSGEVQIVNVPKTDANSSLSARDFYTHETAENRWYLIRLDVKALATAPDLPKQ